METIRFNSCAELGDYVKDLDGKARLFSKDSTATYSIPAKFFGNWTIEQAIECAQNGGAWSEGADAMPTVDVPHTTLDGHALATPQLDTDIAGFAPNVPAFLSGTPDSMFIMDDTSLQPKLIKVAVHVGRLSDVTQKQAFNRGAAIMAVLNQLSREGYAIELWAIWRNTGNNLTASIETCIKHGNDFWSPESVAFALCHVAFQRRLCWRVCEAMPTTGVITSAGYGNGIDAKFPDYDISFPYVTNGDEFSNMDKAVRVIKKETIKQLKVLA